MGGGSEKKQSRIVLLSLVRGSKSPDSVVRSICLKTGTSNYDIQTYTCYFPDAGGPSLITELREALAHPCLVFCHSLLVLGFCMAFFLTGRMVVWEACVALISSTIVCITVNIQDRLMLRDLQSDPLETEFDKRLRGACLISSKAEITMAWQQTLQVLTTMALGNQPVHVIDMSPVQAITLIANASAPHRAGRHLPTIDLRAGSELWHGDLPSSFHTQLPAERCTRFILDVLQSR